jgi:hypothetical protein
MCDAIVAGDALNITSSTKMKQNLNGNWGANRLNRGLYNSLALASTIFETQLFF